MKQLLKTFQGADGQLSARRITAFVFVMLEIYVIAHDMFNDQTDNAVELAWTLSVEVLLLFGVVTADNIIKLRYGNK